MGLVLEDIEAADRYQNFIVFEPASSRILESDVLFRGEPVQQFYDQLMTKLVSLKLTLRQQTLFNRLTKIGQMLELLKTYDNVVITCLFDRIWRRYSYVSHLGEAFLTLPDLVHYFPEYAKDCTPVIANRYGVGFDDEDGFSDDDSDDSDDSEGSDTSKTDSSESTSSPDAKVDFEKNDDA